MTPYQILQRPIVTEKSVHYQNTHNTWTFQVHQDANKVEIRKAIEALFKVKVTAVRTMTVRPKTVRRGRSTGQTAAWKKAYIRVAEGQKLEGI
jgi:large subunit ribosomal protein L23